MRFVPRGFMHLSGLISFNCSIERRSRTLSWRWRHTQSGYVSASRSTLVRIFGGDQSHDGRGLGADLQCCVRWSDNGAAFAARRTRE